VPGGRVDTQAQTSGLLSQRSPSTQGPVEYGQVHRPGQPMVRSGLQSSPTTSAQRPRPRHCLPRAASPRGSHAGNTGGALRGTQLSAHDAPGAAQIPHSSLQHTSPVGQVVSPHGSRGTSVFSVPVQPSPIHTPATPQVTRTKLIPASVHYRESS
jgi:hypothetical protein